MTQLQTNRLARSASLALIQRGHTVDLDRVQRPVYYHLRQRSCWKRVGGKKTCARILDIFHFC